MNEPKYYTRVGETFLSPIGGPRLEAGPYTPAELAANAAKDAANAANAAKPNPAGGTLPGNVR